MLLGNIEQSQKVPDQAEANFKAAITSQPKSNVGYQALANFYIHQGKADAALNVFQAGLRSYRTIKIYI